MMIIPIRVYLFVVPVKRAAKAADKTEVLSLAQRLERVTIISSLPLPKTHVVPFYTTRIRASMHEARPLIITRNMNLCKLVCP